MEGGKRKLSKWNLFVKKIYQEGKKNNPSYSFQQALSDASKRKGEMGSMKSESVSMSARGTKKSRKQSKSKSSFKKSRKNRKH
jgi:hypothetical protein